jgi:hypothetical protein
LAVLVALLESQRSRSPHAAALPEGHRW